MAFVLSLFSHVQLFETPGSSVHGILLARMWILARSGLPFPSPGDLPRDQTLIFQVSYIGRWVLYHQRNREALWYVLVASVVSDSVRPHRQQPTRLPHPWDSPGKNTGVGCHFLLQCMKVKSESEVAQRPHGLQPTRLLCPWDFAGKSTGVGCHCLLCVVCLGCS